MMNVMSKMNMMDKTGMMPKMSVLLMCISLAFAISTLGQSTSDVASLENDKRPLFNKKQAIKISPVFGRYVPVGAALFYERGFSPKNYSLEIGLRYHGGSVHSITDSLGIKTTIDSIPTHLRIELQPRYWTIRQYYPVFFGPSIIVYHNAAVAGGISAGFVTRLTNHLYIEGALGFITTSIEEFGNAPPLYIRTVWSIAYKWNGKGKSESGL